MKLQGGWAQTAYHLAVYVTSSEPRSLSHSSFLNGESVSNFSVNKELGAGSHSPALICGATAQGQEPSWTQGSPLRGSEI